ncbi:MAG: hypothetical protein ACRDFC_00295 [Ignavibacteria bacterium]
MKKSLPYLFLIAAFIIFISNIIQKIFYASDDTFIYMQYARNIASGNGFSFNAGEPSYGVTSPLWVLILSIAYLVGADGFWFAKIFDLLFSVSSAVIFYKLADILFNKDKFLVAISTSIFVVNIWFIRWTFTGMETSLAVFCVLFVLYSFYKNKYYLTFIILGVFYLIRPESFVLAIVLFFLLIYQGIREKNLNYKYFLLYLLLFFVIAAPFLIYAKVTFSTIVPNTTLGKATFNLNINTIFEQVKEIFRTLAPSNIAEIIFALVYIPIALKRNEIRSSLPLILWPSGLLLLYIITDSDIISRYLIIITPMFSLLAVKMIEVLMRKNSKRGIIMGFLFFIAIAIQSQFVFYGYVKPHTENFTAGMRDCFKSIGIWFNENTPPGSRILVGDIGVIGYYAERYIIDAAALANRDLELNKNIMKTPLEERMSNANLLKFVNADYLVERDTTGENSLSIKGDYKLDYLFYKKFPGLGISDRSIKYYKIYKLSKN